MLSMLVSETTSKSREAMPMRLLLSLICSADSSPDTYRTLPDFRLEMVGDLDENCRFADAGIAAD